MEDFPGNLPAVRREQGARESSARTCVYALVLSCLHRGTMVAFILFIDFERGRGGHADGGGRWWEGRTHLLLALVILIVDHAFLSTVQGGDLPVGHNERHLVCFQLRS